MVDGRLKERRCTWWHPKHLEQAQASEQQYQSFLRSAPRSLFCIPFLLPVIVTMGFFMKPEFNVKVKLFLDRKKLFLNFG
jgi:hypothetical protein